MDDMLELGKRILAQQPFSILIGAELVTFSQGLTELKIPIRSDLMQQHGFVHGGVISYAADTALAFTGGSVLGTGVVTLEFKVNYLRPVIGDFIVARATALYSSKSQAICRCDIFVSREGKENFCATAQGTIAKMNQPSNQKSAKPMNGIQKQEEILK